MSVWETLDVAQHRRYGWRKYRNYEFAQREHLCPVQMAEVTQLLPWFPLAMVPVQEKYMQLVALLGLEPGVNLYLSDAYRWQVPYIPAHFRGYPFSLTAEGRLQFDVQSGLMAEHLEPDVVPFFDDDGNHGELVRQLMHFLEESRKGLQLTQKLVYQLQQADLIEPWPIQVEKGEQTVNIQGVYRVSEPKLRALSGETYQKLAHTGALGLAYVQIFSQVRLKSLYSLLQRRRQQSEAADAVDLDQLFGGQEDDMFRF